MNASKTPPFSSGDSGMDTDDLPSAQPQRIQVEIGALTHVGKVRPNNEDQYLVACLRKSLQVLHSSILPADETHLSDREGYLMLVADGMGGAAAGERASAMVVEAAKKHVLETAKWFFRLDDPDENVRIRLLRESLERIDNEIIEAADNDPALYGMGTTLTAASSIGADVFIVHVGDSRAYLFRDGSLEQLTHDHTLTQEMIKAGLVPPGEARTHRYRNVLTNVLGGKPGVKGELHKLRLTDGDRLLLCTDGLTDGVTDQKIVEILSRHSKPSDACEALVDAALARGGSDNITVVLGAYAIGD